MSTMNESMNALTEAFTQFKNINDERLLHLERKGSVDPLLEEKLSRVEQTLVSLETRLNQQDVAHKRPQYEQTADHQASSTVPSAFKSYLAKGEELDLRTLEQKSLSVSSDPDGGYIVPPYLSDIILKDMEDYSPLRKLANVIIISTDAVEMLIDRDHLGAGWVTEKAERPETETPELAKMRIPVHEMYAKPRATQKLLEDALINVEQWLVNKVAQKMAHLEGEAFIKGEGFHNPQGLLSYPLQFGTDNLPYHIEGIKTGANGSFAEENPADSLIELIYALKPAYLSRACWLMSRTTLAEVRKLKDRMGNYLWQPTQEPGARLLGYPVALCEDMPPLKRGTASTSIVFGDFKEGYCIVDRTNTRVLRDPFSAKPYVEFYVTRRVGGDVTNTQALKGLHFSA